MSGRIYLIDSDNALRAMEQRPYADENIFQTLLEDYPDLLAGDQIDETAPRRWLLVARELGIPDSEESSNRWSLDHLFLDQDGIPTLVEVKRKDDTRLRRDVVGQMLDYAANAVAYLPVASLRATYEAACEDRGEDPVETLLAFLAADPDASERIEAYWQQVKTNLQTGKIRLVFVADQIPSELQRIVEFLNEQMDPAEVLALELPQFVGDGLRTIVPRVIGQTAVAQNKRATGNPLARAWTAESFFELMADQVPPEEVAAARTLLAWSGQHADEVRWSQNAASNPSFGPILAVNGQDCRLFAVQARGKVKLYFRHYQRQTQTYASTEAREALRLALNAIPGVDLPAGRIDLYPKIRLSALATDEGLAAFLAVYEEFITRVREETK